MSFLPLVPANRAIDLAKAAGFDGIEIMSSSWTRDKFGEYIRKAEKLGMCVHAHQPWSYAESNAPDAKAWLAEKVGYLPCGSYSLHGCMPKERLPKIVYADRIMETQQSLDYWFQTCPVRFEGMHKIYLDDFMHRWQENPNPICFDFQHYLEWSTGTTMTPRNFLGMSPGKMEKMLVEGFEFFHPHVKEIHLTDSRPELGLKGLNVLTGSGVLPLKEVCKHIVSMGWTGYVVPEVTPKLGSLILNRKGYAAHMLESARNLFS